MRLTRVLAPALLALLAFGTPAAHAGTDSTYAGGCGFDAVDDSDGTYRGVVYTATAVYSTGTPADNPVAATVSCYLKVNGVTQPGTRLTVPGIGVIAGAGAMTYTAHDFDSVEFCTEVDFTSNDTPTHTECEGIVGGPPPPALFELVEAILDAVGDILQPLLTAAGVDGPLYDCGYDTFQATARGTYTGVGYGYIVSPDPGEAVSLRCVVKVNGVEAAATPTATGRNVALSAGPLEFEAGLTDRVDFCAQWTAGADGGETCYVSVPVNSPPQEVCDFIREVTFGHVDPTFCPLF